VSNKCPTCDEDLWVCEKHAAPLCADCNGDTSMPCPECNEGLARGVPDYDFVLRVTTDTTIDVSDIPQQPRLKIVKLGRPRMEPATRTVGDRLPGQDVCGTCAWLGRTALHVVGQAGSDYGCRRHAPGSVQGVWSFPRVDVARDWCGDHKPVITPVPRPCVTAVSQADAC
jgi:hypothetical protein